MSNLTVIIPTYNEEKNIETAIDSLRGLALDVHVIDSFSTDRTVEIAKRLGAKVYQGDWSTFSEKINWAAQNPELETDWVMRLDADEVITEEFRYYLSTNLDDLDKFDAYAVKRRFKFLGRLFKYGGMNNLWDIRLWKKSCAQMESRPIDEHIIVNGTVSRLNFEIIDDNQKNLEQWIAKHNIYSTKEVLIWGDFQTAPYVGDRSSRIRRWLKNKVYYRIPLFLRPFLFFTYRYIFLLGFLDGRPGLIFHVLHSFWYRFLVDAKIYEKTIK